MHSNPKYKIEEEIQVWRAQFSRSAAGQNVSLTFCCVGANFQNFKFCIFHLDFLDYYFPFLYFPLFLFVFSTFPLCIFHFPLWPFVFSTTFCIFKFNFLYFELWLFVLTTFICLFSSLSFCIFHFYFLYFPLCNFVFCAEVLSRCLAFPFVAMVELKATPSLGIVWVGPDLQTSRTSSRQPWKHHFASHSVSPLLQHCWHIPRMWKTRLVTTWHVWQ